MKEIGGYFGLEEHTCNNGEYYKNLIALNTASNALVYTLKSRKIKKIYIPFFLCNCVANICDREGYIYEYYNIDEEFRPIFDKKISEDEYLYLVNFYGQIEKDEIIELKNKYNRIIVDNAQAFFQKPINGVDTIYSCRKFFGVPDGSYLSAVNKLNEELPIDFSEDRTSYIYGRIRDGASAHYAEFRSINESFGFLPLRRMSDLTHKMLSVIDYEKIKKIREENYRFLHEQLGDKNKLRLHIPEGPYSYPFYCENGMEIKKKLAEKKIYVATLWPNVLDLDNTMEKEYAENILPLPCDQRYNTEDLTTVVSEVLYLSRK